MSKNDKPIHNDAAEYLERVEWENQQSQRRVPLPSHMEPKWTYRKVGSASASEKELNNVWRFVGITLAVLCAGIAYFLGIKVALPAVLIISFFVIFFWLAVRDASKKPNDDD